MEGNESVATPAPEPKPARLSREEKGQRAPGAPSVGFKDQSEKSSSLPTDLEQPSAAVDPASRKKRMDRRISAAQKERAFSRMKQRIMKDKNTS